MKSVNRTVAALLQAQRFLEGKANEAQVSGLDDQSYHYNEAAMEVALAAVRYRREVLSDPETITGPDFSSPSASRKVEVPR